MSSAASSLPDHPASSALIVNMPTHPPELLREQEWEKRKMRIWHLLFEKKKQGTKGKHNQRERVEYICDQMKKEGFRATPKEYESHLRSWGFYLNDPISTKKYITHRIEKRKLQRKKSAVVVAGIQWSEERIKKESVRNFYTTKEMMEDPNPRTPPGPMVSVCSPSPEDLGTHFPFESPSGLPWLRFTRLLHEAPTDLIGMMVQPFIRSEPGTNKVSIFRGNLTFPQLAQQLGISLPQGISNPIQLSAYFRSTMPETTPGEHLMRSQAFTKDPSSCAREFLTLALYQISNHLSHHIGCQVRRDELLLNLIAHSDLIGSIDHVVEDYTVQSILEQACYAALRRCRSKLLSWLLDIGINLGLRLETKTHALQGDLALVWIQKMSGKRCCIEDNQSTHPAKTSDHEVEATIRVLLAHGASPDLSCCLRHGTPLEFAFREGRIGIVKTFIEHGINTQGQAYLQKMDFGKLLLLPRWDTPLETQDDMLVYLQNLFAMVNPPPGDLFDTLLSTDGLISAAQSGCSTLLNKLRAKGADFNCHNSRGEFPLGAALDYGHSRYTTRYKTLIELGASVNYVPRRNVDQEIGPSALHFAALEDGDSTLKFLLRNGANQHARARLDCLYNLRGGYKKEPDLCARSPLSWALWKERTTNALLLLKSGAPTEGHELLLFLQPIWQLQPTESTELVTALIERGTPLDLKDSSGNTALDLANRRGYHQIAGILLRAGATMSTSVPLDWLICFKTFIATNYDCSEDELVVLLEDWYPLLPCVSVESQNELLDALVEGYCYLRESYYPSYKGYLYRRGKFDVLLASVLKRYPRAYSSTALRAILRHRKKKFVTKHMTKPENSILRNRENICLPLLRELLNRRSPKFIDKSIELECLQGIVDDVLNWNSTNLLECLEVLLSQRPRLSRMRSVPWHNPLIPVLMRCTGGYGKIYSVEYAAFVVAVLGKLLGSGFRANTCIGLKAIHHGCSINELEKLMDLGFNPRQRYRWSCTALQVAARRNDLEMARFLMSHGVNINGCPLWAEFEEAHSNTDAFGIQAIWLDSDINRTALQAAVECGNWECAKLLVASGAEVNAPPACWAGATALQLAAMKGYIGLVQWLISLGAQIHAPGARHEGLTAIEGAASAGRLDVVGVLFEGGDFRDGEGRRQLLRAVGYARKEGHRALAFYMESQIGWSKKHEELLAQEELLEELDDMSICVDEHCLNEDDDAGSVDDTMEPNCCFEEPDPDCSSSLDEEPISDVEDLSENQSSCSEGGARSTRQGHEASEAQGEEDAPWMSWMDQMDTMAAPASGETSDEIGVSQVLEEVDWGFLAEAEPVEHESPVTTTAKVVGEDAGSEHSIDEQSRQNILQEWTKIISRRKITFDEEKSLWDWGSMVKAIESWVDADEDLDEDDDDDEDGDTVMEE